MSATDNSMSHATPVAQRQDALRAQHAALFMPIYESHWRAITWCVLAMALFIYGLMSLGVTFARLYGGIGELGSMVMRMLPPDPGRFNAYLYAMLETLAIALLGTLAAAIAAFPLGFFAARNTTLNRLVQFMARRSFDTLRGVDILIWALIWINVVGLGPFAGVLAIMTSDIGAFSKLYSEAIEAIDRRAGEGVTSTGGSRVHAIRFGIVP